MARQAETKSVADAKGGGRRGSILSEGFTRMTAAKLALIVVLLAWPLIYRAFTDTNSALTIMTQAGLYAILTLSVGLVLGQA